MTGKKAPFDRIAAGNRIASVLKMRGGEELGCAAPTGVSGLADVPKSLVRELAEAHPDVNVRKVKSGKYVFSYKAQK